MVQDISAFFKEDLDKIEFHHEQIINETVYKDSYFENLFNDINNGENVQYYTTERLSTYFEMTYKIHRMLRKLGETKFKLYVVKTSFSNENFFLTLKELTNGNVSNEILIKIQCSISNMTKGIFVTFKENYLFGIMFLNDNYDNETIKHEFIHYLRWIRRSDPAELFTADLNHYQNELNLLKRYFSITVRDIEYVTLENEFETLTNDLLNELGKIKGYHFQNMSERQFAKYIVEAMMIGEVEKEEDYLNRIFKLDFVKERLSSKLSFLMFVFFNIIREKLFSLKNHIFGYFN